MKFFPTDPVAQGEIARLLQRMVAKQEHLDWLVLALIDHAPEWPGPKEVRGLLCTRFKPRDGIEENTSIPGFSPADCETRNLERSERFRQLEDGPRSGTMLSIREVPRASNKRSETALLSSPSVTDAPMCSGCGRLMARNGSRYKCENCGATSGYN